MEHDEEFWDIGKQAQYISSLERRSRMLIDSLEKLMEKQAFLTKEIDRLSEKLKAAQIDRGWRNVSIRWWRTGQSHGILYVRIEPVILRWKRVKSGGKIGYRGIRLFRKPKGLWTDDPEISEIVETFFKLASLWKKTDQQINEIMKRTGLLKTIRSLLEEHESLSE